MPKNMDSPVQIFFLVLLIVMMIGVVIATTDAAKAVDDPNDTTRVYLEQLPALALLAGSGAFQITIFRQSGNIHAQYTSTSASAAIGQALSTFRRAKIEHIRIGRNTAKELHFNRLFYNHRGSSEGKKIGSVQITRFS